MLVALPSRLHPDPPPRKRRTAAETRNVAAAFEESAPIPLRVDGIDKDYLSVDMDRTEEFGKACELCRAPGGEKRVRRRWLTLPRPERRSDGEGGARFLQVAQAAVLGLRRWSALLSDAEEWLTDARNYDYSDRERDELERAGQELLAGLRDTAGTLRHLAEAAGSAQGGAHEAAFRAAVTECIAGQIERAKHRFATMQRHRLEGMWRGDGRPLRGMRGGEAVQQSPVALREVRRGAPVPGGRPERMATGAAAGSRSDALPVDEAPVASSPPYQQQQQMEQASSALWSLEDEWRERDAQTQRLEHGMVELSQLLQQFALEIAKQANTVESVHDEAVRAHMYVQRGHRELERMQPSGQAFQWFVVVLLVVMALSLLLLDARR